MKHHLHCFVLISFLLVGISPACQFVSGKSLFEICSIDGTKEAKIDADLLVYLPDQPADKDDGHKAQPQCGFCFAQTHLKAATINTIALTNHVLLPGYLNRVKYNGVSKDDIYLNPEARGPPAMFV